MFERIRKWFFYREFNATLHARKRSTGGTNPEKKIAILFDGTSEDDRKTVHRFKKMINKDGSREVKSLAYVDNNLPLDNVDYAAYNRKNLKWYGAPFGNRVEEFISRDEDVLIVLCKEMTLHYEYLIGFSRAAFIIGPAMEKAEKYFDLIIDAGQGIDLDALIRQMVSAVDQVCIKTPGR